MAVIQFLPCESGNLDFKHCKSAGWIYDIILYRDNAILFDS